MKVSKQWIEDFNAVMSHHRTHFPATFTEEAIEECKQEARDNPEWAREYYPRAAAQIREMQR